MPSHSSADFGYSSNAITDLHISASARIEWALEEVTYLMRKAINFGFRLAQPAKSGRHCSLTEMWKAD